MIFDEPSRADATSVSLCNTERIPLIAHASQSALEMTNGPTSKKKGANNHSLSTSIYL
jgi:hypothetical protein